MIPTNNDDFCFASMVLISNLICCTDSFNFFYSLCLRTDININFSSYIQDEAVSIIHGSDRWYNLFNTDVSGALNLEQTFFESVRINVLKARADSTWKVPYTTILKVRQKQLGFVILDFTMLNWCSIQLLV